jgi:hypothetical protein
MEHRVCVSLVVVVSNVTEICFWRETPLNLARNVKVMYHISAVIDYQVP